MIQYDVPAQAEPPSPPPDTCSLPADVLKLARRLAGLKQGQYVLVVTRGRKGYYWQVLQPFADVESGE